MNPGEIIYAVINETYQDICYEGFFAFKQDAIEVAEELRMEHDLEEDEGYYVTEIELR